MIQEQQSHEIGISSMTSSKIRTSYAPTTFFKVLSLMECFSIEEPEMTLKELSKKCTINSSTLYRYLRAMEDNGYILKDMETGKYMVGFHLIELGGIALSRMEVRHHGQITLDKLSSKLQFNANIGILYEGDLMHIAFAVQEDSGSRHGVIGRRTPAHCTAMGKILLASVGQKVAHNIVSTYGWRPCTPYSINSFQRLDLELDVICQNGFAIDRRECSDNITCIAYPILSRNSKVVAAVSVSGNINRMENDKVRIKENLCESAENLSNKLGFLGRYPQIRIPSYWE